MALPTLDSVFASAANVPRKYMLAQWLVNELGSGAIADYITLPERYLWAKIAVAAGAPLDEASYISLPKQYVWKAIYDSVSGSSLGTIDWSEKQALGHIAAAYRGDTGNAGALATYIDWPWRYQVASIIGGISTIPTDGLIIRLNADYGIVESGGVVQSWTDQKSGFVATPFGGPTISSSGPNGRKAVNFDGNNDYFTFAYPSLLTSGKDRAYAIIGKYTNASTSVQGGFINGVDTSSGVDNGYLFKADYSEDAYFFNEYDQVGPLQFVQNQYFLHIVNFQSQGDVEMIVNNNSTLLTFEAIAEDIGSFFIGSRNGSNEFLYGGIAEILIYDRLLTPNEIIEIKEYSGVV
jgi:hypothetical protein